MTMDFLLIRADRMALPHARLPERIDALLPERVREVQFRYACTERKDISSVWFHKTFSVGEGTGYAGGIMSVTIDGARAAQALARDGLIPG